jgi:excisionase family DNA binding protein
MNTNTPVLLMNQKAFINEVQQLLKDQKREIIMELKNNRKNDLFTRKELAKYLRVTQQTIINWSANGILKPTYIGNRVYYKSEEVDNLLKR